MSKLRKPSIVLLVLLVFGGVRLHFERQLMEDLREARLIRAQMEIGTRDRIGQTFYMVSMGGMRSLVATFFNLHAHVCFEERRWNDLEQTYEVIVDLAPHTRYYWESGAWHLSYNAASYYLYDSELPAMRRREKWRHAIHQGRDFLERGILNNPEDWSLHASLGSLLRDPNKLPAFRDRDQSLLQASDAFAHAASLGGRVPLRMERFSFYSLAQVPGHEEEALQMGRRLYESDPRHHKPTLLILLYVLECHVDPERDVEALALELFGDAKSAYRALKLHWQRSREGFPLDGVAQGLALFENRLGVPSSESVLHDLPSAPPGIEDWFESR